MGRQPCCDKVGLKKGPWTAEEDQKLVSFILGNGQCCWRAVPKLAGACNCDCNCNCMLALCSIHRSLSPCRSSLCFTACITVFSFCDDERNLLRAKNCMQGC